MKPKLLLQACCGPCATHTIDVLSKKYDVKVFFYGSNIQPQDEYMRRLEAVFKISPDAAVVPYNESEFLNAVIGLENESEGGARCTRCFELRLRAAAQYARDNGFNCFASSLTISPHKNADFINRIGMRLGTEYGINYLSADFKSGGGFQKSVALSKSLGIYRQNYCGCQFSKR